jgi:LPXTG-site transpeptidase (sortase) family protein
VVDGGSDELFKFLKGDRSPAKRISKLKESFKAATPRRKALFSLGAVSFVAGVTLLGVGAYSALNGSDGGPPRNDGIAGVIITPSPRPSASPTDAPTVSPQPEPPLGDRPYQMVISKIGVNAPVQEYGLDENAVPLVPTGSDAADVVAWYNFSAKPGTGGNAVFAGHVTWNGVAVFYNLTSMAAGDVITLTGQDGTVLTYTVTDVFSVNPTIDPNARDVMLPTPDDVLTIITCSGTFTHDPNDHVFGGDYEERLVVRAKLDGVQPGSAVAAATQ